METTLHVQRHVLPHLISERTGVSNTRGVAFLWVFRYYTNQKVNNFYCVYLMLDLLKHFLVVDHSKEYHNETVDYRRNLGGLLDQLEKSSKAIETLNQ